MQTANFSQTMQGTPAFMAPEIYKENYDTEADIYSFGLCMLEMIIMETPYDECENLAQIIDKVTHGLLPEGLDRIED